MYSNSFRRVALYTGARLGGWKPAYAFTLKSPDPSCWVRYEAWKTLRELRWKKDYGVWKEALKNRRALLLLTKSDGVKAHVEDEEFE